eukprot:1458623-Alexandrium_andersonii.AAC.1
MSGAFGAGRGAHYDPKGPGDFVAQRAVGSGLGPRALFYFERVVSVGRRQAAHVLIRVAQGQARPSMELAFHSMVGLGENVALEAPCPFAT